LTEKNRKIFKELYRQWYWETKRLPNAIDHINHPNYKKIVDMGKIKENEDVITIYILYAFRRREYSWMVWALEEIWIDKPSPIKPEHQGNLVLMCEDWFDWAYEVGICTERPREYQQKEV
jgi:hypothetical protein